jgi:hypothetical protein
MFSSSTPYLRVFCIFRTTLTAKSHNSTIFPLNRHSGKASTLIESQRDPTCASPIASARRVTSFQAVRGSEEPSGSRRDDRINFSLEIYFFCAYTGCRAMKKSKSLFKIEKHPTVLGKDITSKKSMLVAGVLILTGILAPIGMIMLVMGGHHRAKKASTPKKHRK